MSSIILSCTNLQVPKKKLDNFLKEKRVQRVSNLIKRLCEKSSVVVKPKTLSQKTIKH